MLESFVGGIPSTAFQLNKEGRVPGKSGQEISFRNTYNRIEIDQGNFSCYAFVEDGYFRLVLRTRDQKNPNARPPDLFAQLFAQAAQQQFRENGKRINGFKAVWMKGSDNYEDFQKNLKNNLSKNEAARMTWSGKLAKTLGYETKVVVNIYPKDEYVTAVFT